FESGPEFQVDAGEQIEFDMATVEESDRIGTLDDPTMAGRLWDEFIFQAQDRFNYLSKEQMEAARVRRMAGMGEELPEDMDAYLAELRYHGMAGAAIDEFQEEFVQPLIDTVSENKLEIDEIDKFLHARHAEEANAQLKEINPDLEDNEALSGMTDDQAVQVLAEIRKSDKSEVYQKVADIVDSITKADRENRVDYGLEKPQTVKKWEKTYKYYVPLMREGKGSKLPAKGKGYDIKGGQKRRAGSQRSVINVLAYAISQAESTIVRGEKNKVSTALYNFATENEGPWQADKVEYKAVFDNQGLVHYRPDPSYRLADNVVHLRIEGEDHHITFDQGNHNAVRIAQAMKKLKTGDSGPLVSILSHFTRWLAMVNTGLNPEFIISNFLRDLQTAGYNMSDSEAQAIKWTAIREVGQAWRGIRQFQKGTKETEWGNWFDQFRKAGAQTGWMQSYENIEKRENDLMKKVKQMGPGAGRKFKRGLSSIFDLISDENTAVENAIRLSVFKNLREKGISEAKAARIAKELTVNFNRKGNAGQAINALYLFYNASIQGSARIIVAAAKSPKIRKLILSTVIFATALD
ncbi:MAG: hypothetical protein KAS92_00500, partial [Candidatus Omnitrophica bacterium]|nr:hypothetical protein [Candidatus Omnitrophota bacterium]